PPTRSQDSVFLDRCAPADRLRGIYAAGPRHHHMALTLEQYATYLDTRGLPWPAPPEVERPKAKAYLVRLPEIRAVTWNIYGTLLAISGGELYFQHPVKF